MMQEMVYGVVGTFQDHRSLALTLQDSEHVARKLGLLLMTLVIFILVVSDGNPTSPTHPCHFIREDDPESS